MNFSFTFLCCQDHHQQLSQWKKKKTFTYQTLPVIPQVIKYLNKKRKMWNFYSGNLLPLLLQFAHQRWGQKKPGHWCQVLTSVYRVQLSCLQWFTIYIADKFWFVCNCLISLLRSTNINKTIEPESRHVNNENTAVDSKQCAWAAVVSTPNAWK